MNLPLQGYNPALCLDFDFAVVAFHGWFEGKANERKQVPEPPPLRKRHVMGARYTDAGQILALYGAAAGGNGLDPIVAGLTDDDLAGFMGSWTDQQPPDESEGLPSSTRDRASGPVDNGPPSRRTV